MRRWAAGLACLVLVGCSMEPSNTDLGLRIEADVAPRVVSLRDSTAALRIRVVVTNPSDADIHVVTGGPPYVFTGDPLESHGLLHGYRIASAAEPLNGGPSGDWWGTPVDTIRARRGVYAEDVVTLRQWRAGGWPLAPGVYRVRSFYNGHEGTSASFQITP